MINFVRVIEGCIFVLVLSFFITQIFIPAIRGTLLFPFFRRSGDLEKKLSEVRQKKLERDLEKTIIKEKRK